MKALELLTQCYIMVQGNTVATLGPYKGLKQVRTLCILFCLDVLSVYNALYFDFDAVHVVNYICSDEGLTLETSAFESLYGG